MKVDHKYYNEKCNGVKIVVRDKILYHPLKTAIEILEIVNKYNSSEITQRRDTEKLPLITQTIAAIMPVNSLTKCP